jgi:hypothetical protein
MGTFGGDIVLSEFPARIPLAIYIEYIPTTQADVITLLLMRDDDVVAKIDAEVESSDQAVMVIPRAVVKVERECTFKIMASVNRGASEEILRKTIRQGEIQSL